MNGRVKFAFGGGGVGGDLAGQLGAHFSYA